MYIRSTHLLLVNIMNMYMYFTQDFGLWQYHRLYLLGQRLTCMTKGAPKCLLYSYSSQMRTVNHQNNIAINSLHKTVQKTRTTQDAFPSFPRLFCAFSFLNIHMVLHVPVQRHFDIHSYRNILQFTECRLSYYKIFYFL